MAHGDLGKKNRTLGEEVRAQLLDQFLHLLMTSSSVYALCELTHYCVGFTGMGPTILNAISLAVGLCGTSLWNALREWVQWPSSRWWDPPLDWTFLVIGMGLGGWLWWLAPRIPEVIGRITGAAG